VAKCGRKPVLDEIKQAEIAAILATGCSRRTAAKYVGCAPATIRNTADRDPDFAEKLRRAEGRLELKYLRWIEKAAEQDKYWRAAAWVLERKFPDDYGLRAPGVITFAQIRDLLSQFAEIIVEEVPVDNYRKSILKRLDALSAGLQDAAKS